jgi:tetratricopeptide (TPR) repeat protein
MAYAMAVGTLDLKQGLAAVDESLRIIANVPAILDPAGVLCFGRAVTAQDAGDNQLALSQVSEARDHAEAVLLRITREKAVQKGNNAHRSLALTNELPALRTHLAGILELRAQLCDQLDKPEEAAKDRQRKNELASDGNLAEANPYDLSTAIERVSGCAGVLDTRGYLLYKLGTLNAAYDNLQYAVEASERVCQALPGRIESMKHFVSDIRPLVWEERRHQRTWAVVIYHRMLVLEAQGKQQEAEQDRQKIRDLGYEPGDPLF